MRGTRKGNAFTLIELLIVVAIIAILAAIAVPNFLEAQIRSKIARAKADMRSVATGLEAYFVDWNGYPAGSRGPDLVRDATELTTPIAYLTTAGLSDPFGEAWRWGDNAGASAGQRFARQAGVGYKYFFLDYYEGLSTWARRANLTPDRRQMAYVLYSYGPDFAQNLLEWFAVGRQTVDALYDPTNGTVSQGDFGRCGGAARSWEASMINR